MPENNPEIKNKDLHDLVKSIKTDLSKGNFKVANNYEASPYTTAPEAYGFGDSKYDKSSTSITSLQENELNEIRAQRQSALDKAANGIVRASGRAVASFVNGTAGTIYGVGSALSNGDFTKLYDNDVTRLTDKMNNAIDSSMPLYQTKEYQNASLLEKLTKANLWFGDVLSGVGYTVGAIGTGALSSSVYKGISKLALTGELESTLANTAKSGEDVLKTLSKASTKKLAAGDELTASMFSAIGEAGDNARQGSDTFYNTRLDEVTKQYQLQGLEVPESVKDQIKLESKKLGEATFLANLPIIAGANFLQFGKTMTNIGAEKKAASELFNNVEDKIVRDVNGNFTAKTLTKGQKAGKLAESLLASPVEEGTQEQLQKIIDVAANDFYTKRLKGKDTSFNDVIDGSLDGFKQAYGTEDGWSNFVVGALSAMLTGSVTAKSQIREALKNNSPQVQAALQVLNTYKSDAVFKELIQSTKRNNDLSQDITEAAKNNDKFEFNNKQSDLLTSYVLSRVKTGQYESLEDDLNKLKSLSEEDFQKQFGVNPKESNKNSVIELIQDKLDKAKDIKDTYESVNELFPTLSEGNKERMVHSATTISDVKDRRIKLEKQFNDIIVKDKSDLSLLPSLSKISDPEEFKSELDNSTINPIKKQQLQLLWNDLQKLNSREKEYTDLYNSLLDPKVQKVKDAEDAKNEQQAENETSLDINDLTDENPFEDVTNEEQISTDEITGEDKQSNPFYNLIDNASNPNELYKITQQADEAGANSPELTDYIAKRNEDFLIDEARKSKTREELEKFKGKFTKQAYKEELNKLWNSLEKPKSTISKTTTSEDKTNFFNTFSGKKKGETKEDELNRNKIINGININNPEDVAKLSIKIDKIPTFKGSVTVDGIEYPYTTDYEISLNYNDNGNNVFLGFLVNPTGVPANNNVYNQEQQKLATNLLTFLIKGAKQNYSVQELIDNRLFDLVKFNGAYNIIENPKERALLSESGDTFFKDPKGQIYILDSKDVRDGKATYPTVLNGGNFIDLFGDKFTFQSTSGANLDRYSTVVKRADGTFVFIAAQPNLLSTKEVDKQFTSIKKQSDKAFKENSTETTNAFNDEFNSDLNNNFYISVGKEFVRVNNIDFVELKVMPKGGVKLAYKKDGEAKDVEIFYDELNNINSFNDLVNALNKKLKKDISADFQSLEELTGEKPKTIVKQEADFQLKTDGALRHKISEINVEEASNNLKTSLDLNNPFNPSKLSLKYKEPIVLAKESPKVEEVKPVDNSVKEDIKSIPLSIKQTIDNQASEDLTSGDFISKISNVNSETIIDLNEAIKWIKSNLPSFVDVQDINVVLDNIKAKGISWGAFKNGVIYLSEQAGKGTEYHEAFHAVFRMLLPDSKIDSYIKLAKQERGKVTPKEVEDFKAKYDLKDKSFNYVENLIYEEYMADKFMAWRNNKSVKTDSKFKQFFAKIASWIKFVLSNKSTLDALFYKIDNGYFKNSTPIKNRFNLNTTVNKLIPTINPLTKQVTYLNSVESEKIISQVLLKWTNAISQKTTNKVKNNDLLDTVISNLKEFYNPESDYNQGIYNSLSEDKKKEFESTLVKEYFSFTNKSVVELIKSEVKKRKDLLIDDSDIEKYIDKKEQDEGNRWDLQASSIGGYDSLSKAVKGLISTTVINEEDKFGREITRTVDTNKVYSGIERTLANTPKTMFMEKLIAFAEFNPEAQAFVNKLKFLLDYNEQTGEFNQDKPVWKAFQMNFNKFKVDYLTNLFNFLDNTNTIAKANRKDIDERQLQNWRNNFNLNFQNFSKDQKIAVLQNAIGLWNDNLLPTQTAPISDENAIETVKKLKKLFDSIGFEFSQGYLLYSLLYYRDKTTDKQTKMSELFKGVNPIQKYGNTNTAFKDVLSIIFNDGETFINPFLDEKKDAVSKIKALALNNAEFDENIGSSTFQNADGENVFSYVYGNNTMRKTYSLQDPKRRDISSLETFKRNNPELTDYEAEIYYSIYKVNPLLNSEISDVIFDKDFKVNFIDGNNESLNKEGSTFKSMTIRDLALLSHSAYANAIKKGNKKFAYTYVKVLESSSTGFMVPLPIDSYFDKGLNTKGVDTIYNFFTQEYERIGKIQDEINNPDRKITVKDVHNGKLRGLKFFNFKFLPAQLKQDLENLAKNKEELSPELEVKVKEEIKKHFDRELANHIKELEDLNVITQAKDKDGNPIPKVYVSRNSNQNLLHKAFFTGDDSRLITSELGNSYFNDLINSWSYNNLVDGDVSYSRKDAIDFVKRNRGANAMQQTYGEGYSKGAIIKEPKENVLGYEKDTADAQMWETLKWRKLKLTEKGLMEDGVKKILDSIEQDNTRDFYEVVDNSLGLSNLDDLLEASAMILSDKDIYYDGMSYFKLSSFALTRQYTSVKVPEGTEGAFKSPVNSNYYISQIGREWENNLLNNMEKGDIQYVMPESASKGMTQNVSTEDNLSPITYFNGNWGMQHVVPSNKTQITDGSQKNTLLPSEYKTEEGKKLSKEHEELLSQRIKVESNKAFNLLRNNLGDREYTLKYVIDRFRETLEETGSDLNLLELFSKNELTGDAKYSLNMPITIGKFEQFFYAHWTKALYSKAPGYTMVLKSDYGVKVPYLKSDNKKTVVDQSEIDYNDLSKYDTRDLTYNEEEGYGEVLIPAHFKEFGLKPGDNVPTKLLEMFGVRIPTEDKRSMMVLKVVGYLPAYYGSTIIGPKEIILFSGADFDVDKMFIRRYEHFVQYDENGNPNVFIYGNNGNDIKVKFTEYLTYEINNNKDLKKIFKDRISNNKAYQFLKDSQGLFISDESKEQRFIDMDMYRNLEMGNAFKELGLPSTIEEYKEYIDKKGEINLGVINNQLLDKEIALYKLDENKETRKEISDFEDFKTLAEQLDPKKDTNNSIYGMLGKMESKLDNDTGKSNIGPAAISNMVFNLLARNNVKLRFPFKINGETYKEFSFKNKDNERVVSILGKILAAMTDNAKERLASRFNLTTDTLGPALYMISSGVDYTTVFRMMKHPAIVELAKRSNIVAKSGIKTAYERENSDFNKIIDQMIKEYHIDGYKLKNEITDSILNSDSKESKFEVLNFFKKIKKQNDSFIDVNTLMQLNKGFDISIAGNENVFNALNKLGFNLSSKAFEASTIPFDIRGILKNEPYISKLIEVHNTVQDKVAPKFFVTKSKISEKLIDLVRNNLKEGKLLSKDLWNDVYRNTLVYLTTKLYKQHLENSSLKSKDLLLSTLNIDNITDGELLKKFAELKDKYRDNKLLYNLDLVTTKNGLDIIAANTRNAQHPILLEQILNGFQELFVNEETKTFAVNLFNYLIVKDGMLFKNNSIGKYIPAFMYQEFSKAIKDNIDKISGDLSNDDFKKLFGETKEDLIEDYLDVTFLNTETNYDYIKYSNTFFKGIFEFNQSKNRMVFDTTKNSFSDNKSKLSNSIFKPTNDEKFELPLYIKLGDKENPRFYKLVSNQPSSDKTISEMINDDNKVISNYGEYELVEPLKSKDINLYSVGEDLNRFRTNKTRNNLANKLQDSEKISILDNGVIEDLGEETKDVKEDKKLQPQLLSLAKQLGLNKKEVSYETVIKVKEKVKGTNYFVKFKPIGESDTYTWEIVDYTPKVKEKKEEVKTSVQTELNFEEPIQVGEYLVEPWDLNKFQESKFEEFKSDIIKADLTKEEKDELLEDLVNIKTEKEEGEFITKYCKLIAKL